MGRFLRWQVSEDVHLSKYLLSVALLHPCLLQPPLCKGEWNPAIWPSPLLVSLQLSTSSCCVWSDCTAEATGYNAKTLTVVCRCAKLVGNRHPQKVSQRQVRSAGTTLCCSCFVMMCMVYAFRDYPANGECAQRLSWCVCKEAYTYCTVCKTHLIIFQNPHRNSLTHISSTAHPAGHKLCPYRRQKHKPHQLGGTQQLTVLSHGQ